MVAIRDFEIPKSCFYCPFKQWDRTSSYCLIRQWISDESYNNHFKSTYLTCVDDNVSIEGPRDKDCPLVEVDDENDNR